MNDLASLLTECNESGWLINNLCQLDLHLWQANIRTADGRFTDFGRGVNPTQALLRAMEKIDSAEYIEDQREAKVYQGKDINPKLDLAALISGLRKPMEDRRF